LLQRLADALVAFGPWGILLLAFIDSAGIPVSAGMDALVILLGVEAPSRAYLGASMAVLGSVAGNIALFRAAPRGGRRYGRRTTEPGRSQRFRDWFHRYGLVTVFIPALAPIPLPLKVFVISAGVLRVRLRSFLLVILAARVPRYFGEAWLGAKLGRESTRYLQDNAWKLAGFALAVLFFLYVLARLAERFRRGEVDGKAHRNC
jgi:membrane protein YqaA with SNARE-associated domain